MLKTKSKSPFIKALEEELSDITDYKRKFYTLLGSIYTFTLFNGNEQLILDSLYAFRYELDIAELQKEIESRKDE